MSDDQHPGATDVGLDGRAGAAQRAGVEPPPGWWPGEVAAEPDIDVDLDADIDHARPAPPGRASVARWLVAIVVGVAVAALAVLGIDAVASAANSSASRAPAFGPFGGAASRQPPFLSGNGGNAAGQRNGRQRAPAAATTPTTEAVEGTIASIDGDRIEVTTSGGRTAVELATTTNIRDGTKVLAADQLHTGERIRATGTRTDNVLRATTVGVVH